MKRVEIAAGVFVNEIAQDKFKKALITIHFIMKSDKETATAYAILPNILERGFREYPDMTELSIRLSQLYGANLSVDGSIQGANRVISISVCGIKDCFALEGEELLQEYLHLLTGMAFRPYLPDGLFDNKWLDIEKEKQKELLLSEINDKRGYCVKLARREFYGEHICGIEKNGYLDEVDKLTTAMLFDAYTKMLQTAQLEVMVVGAEIEVIKTAIASALSSKARKDFGIIPPMAIEKTPTRHGKKALDTFQGKLCMLFTTNTPLTPDEADKMRVAVSLFGGAPTSRLFVNVREKQSLCYYCSASFSFFNSCLIVDSGVEHKDAKKTEKSILQQLELLIDGEIKDTELNDIKRQLVNQMKSIGDSVSSLEMWEFNGIIKNEARSVQDAIEAVERVTKEEIQAVLKKLSLSLVYTIAGGKKDE